MSHDFHVGQMVVCIYDGPRKKVPGAKYAEKWCVYTIRDLMVCPAAGKLILLLEEIINPKNKDGFEYGFKADAFRPVKPTSIECFRNLLVPRKDEVSA